MKEIKILDKENTSEFLAQGDYVLILGKSDCVACSKWQAELNEALDAGTFSADVPIGKLNLDQRGLADFKRNNAEWLKDINDLPFNAIYKGGEKQKTFVGGGIDRLTTRLKKLELAS